MTAREIQDRLRAVGESRSRRLRGPLLQDRARASMARETTSSASAPRSCTGWRGSTRRSAGSRFSTPPLEHPRGPDAGPAHPGAAGEEADERGAEGHLRPLPRPHPFVNNWDLVDASAPTIVGGYLVDRSRKPLDRLAGSKSLWERRISIVATFTSSGEANSPTRCGSPSPAGRPEDLIHKAAGWMLREVGKRDEADPRRHSCGNTRDHAADDAPLRHRAIPGGEAASHPEGGARSLISLTVPATASGAGRPSAFAACPSRP